MKMIASSARRSGAGFARGSAFPCLRRGAIMLILVRHVDLTCVASRSIHAAAIFAFGLS
jgi:hypothetical protein